jgi:hypothetical protein
VLSISNRQRTGGTNGGGFIFDNAITTFNITANIFSADGGTSQFCLSLTLTNKILNITGNLSTGSGNGSSCLNVATGTGNQITIIGNINGSTSTNQFSNNCINITSSQAKLEITGNVYGSATTTSTTSGYGVGNTATISNFIVYGQSFGGRQDGIVSASSLTVEKAIGGSSFPSYGVRVTGTGAYVVVNEIENPINGGTGVGGGVRWANSSIKITGYRENGNVFILSDGVGDSSFLPNPVNVRTNVVYNLNQSTGTLDLPTADNVRKGVVYDNSNTVGTADLTAQDFLDAMANSSDPYFARLHNVATVETTGGQISAFNV